MPSMGEEEEVKFIKQRVSLYADDRPAFGQGTLFLTTHQIIWRNDERLDETVKLHWRSVIVHAISRDTSAFPHPCIYCQVLADDAVREMIANCSQSAPDAKMNGAEEEEEEEEEEGMEGDEPSHEMRFVMDDPNILGVVFSVFSQCQALHPDEHDDDDEGDFMFDDSAAGASSNICMMNVTDMAVAQQQALARYDALLNM
ncbi:hypothetical protein GUITHDRAFT_122575 [Guillardia theta CCMP2712]|nr:hypothetical protein GUITHDRAFT_122575 [Guillardia theta CCMP2712]EKX31220.1 hypothetical protein GUITHDRAFT_122575 [Guillardia theta CCMP2712]|eukprot:XP_005818200.1 hypothetical protein GUITHDRAFT_122575 [Guillardia theta CCMP2712]